MKPLLGSLLLASFCTLSSRSASSDPLVVKQSSDVSVLEGETVSIACCWTGVPERKTANWLKNQTSIKREVFNLKIGSQGKETSHCLNLTFTSITREDSGRYTCRVSVETPSLIEVVGSGTVITVRSGDNTKNNTTGELPGSTANLYPVIIPLAVVALLLLGALVCVLRRRQVSARAARVIYEVPHIDSEEAEMDKRSTSSSTGSTQWCQVPVYESCDYFERVQTKESG